MPVATLNRLRAIAAEGKRVIFVGHYPESVPGYGRLSTEVQQFDSALTVLKEQSLLAKDYAEALSMAGGRIEEMRTEHRLSCIRRSNPDGHHYFISNLTPNDVDAFVSLGVDLADAVFYNPMTGEITRPELRDGKVRLQLASGESIILRTFADAASHAKMPLHPYRNAVLHEQELRFRELEREDDFHRSYTANFTAKPLDVGRYMLDLGDVRESARVVLNGQEVGTLFAVPFRCDITPFLKKGKNTLRVYVTNLPANRIAQMDRDGVEWRHFKEINVVDLNYKTTRYDQWEPVPSGLLSPVRLTTYR